MQQAGAGRPSGTCKSKAGLLVVPVWAEGRPWAVSHPLISSLSFAIWPGCSLLKRTRGDSACLESSWKTLQELQPSCHPPSTSCIQQECLHIQVAFTRRGASVLPKRAHSEGCTTERLLISCRLKLSRRAPAAVPLSSRRNPGAVEVGCETP